MSQVPISYPAHYAPGVAVSFESAGGAKVVSSSDPLPVSIQAAPSEPRPTALSGTASSNVVLGPLAVTANVPVWLALSGTWAGTVRLLRSTDGGATRLPLTLGGAVWASFTANACEPVWEDSESGAALYLEIKPTSGAVTYRLSQ